MTSTRRTPSRGKLRERKTRDADGLRILLREITGEQGKRCGFYAGTLAATIVKIDKERALGLNPP